MKQTVFCLMIVINLVIPTTATSAEPPTRIVSLAPNITEILYALGLEDRIVGVTNFCDVPPRVREKLRVGGMSNPSLEKVIASRPDLVVMTTDGNPKAFADTLRSFGIPTYIFRARTLWELPRSVRELGSFLGAREKADALADALQSTLLGLSHRSAQPSRHKRVLFVVWPEPLIVAGGGTAIDDAIRLLGHDNIAAGAKMSYPKFSIEEVLRRSPDVIVIGKGHTDMEKLTRGLLQRIASVPAVKNGRVCFIGDGLYRLGPRVSEGIKELTACLE